MRPLSSMELLRVWEQGWSQTTAMRALTLLTAACADMPPDDLARLSIGRRDALLLALREWTFGPQLHCLFSCPACAKQLELTMDVADIRKTEQTTTPADKITFQLAEYQVDFRLPDSRDLIACACDGKKSTPCNRQHLLLRCLLDIRQKGTEVTADQLPQKVVDAIVTRMAEADPQADVQLAMTCPACDHQWPANFDIVSFFWQEIDAWAPRLLREVHLLASAYGWREADILAMSTWRRQAYLRMINNSR